MTLLQVHHETSGIEVLLQVFSFLGRGVLDLRPELHDLEIRRRRVADEHSMNIHSKADEIVAL